LMIKEYENKPGILIRLNNNLFISFISFISFIDFFQYT